jgi:beta-lactamase class A
MSPASEQAFYGPIVARAPSRARTARLMVAGRRPATRRVRNGKARFTLDAPPGRYSLRIQFLRGSRMVGGARANGVWLLPASARKVVAATAIDAAVSRRAAAALRPGPRFGAAWVQDLATGTAGAANAGASFPAASTVKLGMLVSGLPRLGARPQRSPHYYDMRALTRWSSNLATNRLLNRLGGSAFVERGLRRLGARQSTFTGGYIVGTALQPRLPLTGVDVQPPLVSRRVTTAQDLGHMMVSFTAAAAGNAQARRETGLTLHQARLGLGWLLASEQRLENRSLLVGGVARGTPIAQKNGWLRAARHGAGVIFAPSGPKIAVVLTYDAGGVSTTTGRAVGARVAAVATGL